jgi:hypothetical protein
LVDATVERKFDSNGKQELVGEMAIFNSCGKAGAASIAVAHAWDFLAKNKKGPARGAAFLDPSKPRHGPLRMLESQ